MASKNKIPNLLIVIMATATALFFPRASSAVVPPDFIFNIGSQLAQFFSLAFFAIAGFFGFIARFFKDRLPRSRRPLLIFSVLTLALLGAWSFTAWKSADAQREAYDKWLSESHANSGEGLERLNVNEMEMLGQAVSSNASTSLSQPDRLALSETISRTDADASFLDRHKKADMKISNEEFKNLIDSEVKGYLVLDSREGLEHEYGYFPGSLHIRLVDLISGRFAELPKDKVIFVMCWSGIRSRESAEFLASKGFVARYLEDGARGWVNFGGLWEGEINFSKKYSDPRYKTLYSSDEVKTMIGEGVVMIDSRPPSSASVKPFPGAINIPIMYTKADELETKFALVPEKSRFITICDDYINCFDAELVGAELEKRGHEFLGRYNKPWEYEKE